MILSFEALSKYENQLTMVDGSFDPLHEGHIEYFRQSCELGFPVICNIAPDAWTASKHRILLSQSQRSQIIDSIKYVQFVHASALSTADVLKQLKPRVYAKGNDWLKRGGVPSVERELCQSLGVEIVYLDSVLNSSTSLLTKFDSGAELD
jgi:cytidyltransferase-like protein